MTKRVLQVVDDLEVGGVQIIVRDLANALSARGVHVDVVAGPGSLWSDLSTDIGVHRSPIPRGPFGKLAFLRVLLSAVKRGNYDIVHSHQRGVAVLSRIAIRACRSKALSVEHVHNTFMHRRFDVLSFRSDRVIACGSTIALMLRNEFGIDIRRIALVYNAAADLGFHPRPAQVDGQKQRAVSIVAVGRLTVQKNPLKFIDVCSNLQTMGWNVDATWVGGGKMLEEAKVYASTKGTVVNFVGERQNVTQYIALADLMLSTSRWEGLPLTALEALSVGRGVILPGVGSCGDITDGNDVGHLYDSEAPASAIAISIAGFVENGDVERWSKAARDVYLSKFDFSNYPDRILEAYRELHPVSQ